SRLVHHPSLALRASFGWQATLHNSPGWLPDAASSLDTRRMSTVAAKPRRWTATAVGVCLSPVFTPSHFVRELNRHDACHSEPHGIRQAVRLRSQKPLDADAVLHRRDRECDR